MLCRGRICPALSLALQVVNGLPPYCHEPGTPGPYEVAVQCSLRNFSIKSTSLSMPSGGMAL